MCSDIELFVNLIYMTNIMSNLQDKNFEEYLECVKVTQDWEKFKNVQEIINLNNKYINEAIKEVLQNKRFIKKIEENTSIQINKIILGGV